MPCNLRLGERVVWVSDEGPEKGTVQWIGHLPDEPGDNITVGVAFVSISIFLHVCLSCTLY